IITGNKKYTEDYKTLRELFDNYYTEFELSDLTEIEKKLLLDIKSNIDSIDTYSYKIFALKKTGSSEEAINLMEIIDYEFGKNININTTKIFDTIAERIERHKVHGAELKKEQAMVMFYISISGLLFSIIIVVVSYITIVRPIKLLTDFADNIAAGNFESELKVNSKDEIESLANSFNRMSCEIQLSQKILKQNNLFLETVLSTIPSGLMVIDKNGNIKSANKRMGEIINTNPEEIVKKTLDQVLNNSAVKNEIKNIIHDGKNVRNHECRLFDSAQKQKYYDLTLISFEIDEKQNLLIIEDITSRKKAEEKVKQSEAKYKSFIHNFQGIAYRYDFKWQTIFFNGNSKEITGYEYEDIMMNNPSWRDLIFKEDYEYFCKSTEDFLNGSEKVLKRRYRIKRSDDKIIWVQDISEIILIEGSHEYGIQGVIYDITDEILREEKLLLSLQELSKVSLHKDKLLSIISHDLRSPFNALLGSLNILRDNYNDLNETERKEYINISYN
ncbi:MAG: PAS domain S-box protein, partial [Melioribacteraceae bacterium]